MRGTSVAEQVVGITVVGRDGPRQRNLIVRQAIIAGWTGRDPVAVEKHIRELEALGVKRPASTPIFYRVSAHRITTADVMQVPGTTSSGEVEFVLAMSAGELLVGVGSDHTDREVETYNVTVSKQMCDKPIAPQLWPLAEVAPHWDRLMLRSYILERGQRVLYQEGSVATMLAPQDLLGRYGKGKPLAEGSVMFCGTFAAKGGIRAAERFEFELDDPVLGRRITHGYSIASLPVLG